MAHELNLIETAESDTDFNRADAIEIFWDVPYAELYDSERTLAERLVEQEVFTAEELAEAVSGVSLVSRSITHNLVK